MPARDGQDLRATVQPRLNESIGQERTVRKLHLGILLLLAVGAGAFVLVTLPDGAGTSPDSASYISAARSLRQGRGLIRFDGVPLASFPPLYPLALAAIDFATGVDPQAAASGFNAFLLAVTIFVSGLWYLARLKSSAAFALLCTASLAFALPLFYVSLWAWSESLFVCMTSLFLLGLDTHQRQGRTAPLLVAAVTAALAGLTRYIGVFLIPVGVLSILLFRRSRFQSRRQDLAVFLCISGVPLGLWLIRNEWVTGTLTGPRASAAYSLSEYFVAAASPILAWFIPPWRAQYLIFGVLAAILAGVAWLGYRQGWLRQALGHLPLGSAGLYTLTYGFFFVFSAMTVNVGITDNRYLAPVYIPIFLIFAALAEGLFMELAEHYSWRWAGAFLTAGMALWLIYPARQALDVSASTKAGGLLYNNATWRDSATIRYLQRHGDLNDCTLYSNGPDAIYLLTGRAAKFAPGWGITTSREVLHSLADYSGTWPTEPTACLVWFNEIGRGYLFQVDDLKTIAHFERIAQVADGTIYRVTR
jgi:hypothetical protein